MKRFENKVVLVTGGARNTGLEIVDLFLSEGAKVYFCTRAEESLRGGIAELERRGRMGFRGILCSVADPKAVDAMLDEIEKDAANFGIGQGTSLETTNDQFQSVLDVNVLGGFHVVQSVCNRFFMKQERDEYTNQRGVVVFVASNSSERVSRNRVSYVASKGAMDSMMKALAVDLGPLGVRVNMVAPGYIWTDRWQWLSEDVKSTRRANVPTGMEATGRDVAEAVAFFASDAARACQGARLVMDGGSTVQMYPPSCEDDTSKMRER